MKNGYDHHDHQDIYTYNLSVPKRFTLDVPNQSPPLPLGSEDIFTGGIPSRKEDFEGMKRFGYVKKDTKVQSMNQFGIHAFSSQPEPMVLI